MDLMLGPACEYITFGDALKVGWACDDARYFWYEDPYRDGGISQFAHRKLRQLIKTPLLMTEHVRTLEPHVDFALAEATDFLRGAVRNTNYYEMGLIHPKAPASHDSHLYRDGYRDTLDAIDSDGCVPVPQGPGLGVEIDRDWVARSRTALVTYP
jgi:L-alanine-DL-glutamate epimerase-like enolase superfamily enzyme